MKRMLLLVSVLLSIFTMVAHADLIPTNDNWMYYKMGGGYSVPQPANGGATTVPLNVEGNMGLGFNCGMFNPLLSIINSLNSVSTSFQSIQEAVVKNATGALILLPLYLIARSDPSLYDLLTNALLGARRDLELSTKNCQLMQNQIGQGQNPYSNWATASMDNDWKYQMSITDKGQPTLGNNDINLVNKKIADDNGINGVPWVTGTNTGRGTHYAGGDGQPPINVIHDTVVAGYNVILQAGRNEDDETAPVRTDSNAHLVDTWSNPQSAAAWITGIVGEEKITTFASGNKQSTPGVGLLPYDQQLSIKITQQLQDLVSGKSAISLEHLQAVSAPGVMVNSNVINALRQQTPVTQAIYINKLAQEVATAQLIDEALLAKQILQEGSDVPAIFNSNEAGRIIKQAIERLNQSIESLLFDVKVHKELVSDTISELLTQTEGDQQQKVVIPPSTTVSPTLSNGAISNPGSSS